MTYLDDSCIHGATYTEPCQHCDESPEPQPHYHVVAFIDGCLNDYNYRHDTIGQAIDDLESYIGIGGMLPDTECVPAGDHRYVQGPYVIKIESCDLPDPECDGEPY